MTDPRKRHLSVVRDDFVPPVQDESNDIPTLTTPPCPHCGHHLSAAYDDMDDSWWECTGCGRDVENHELPQEH